MKAKKKEYTKYDGILFFIIGIVCGATILNGFHLDRLKGKVCGEVCMDSYDFEMMVDEFYECKVRDKQYEFTFDILELEFNISEKSLDKDRMELYQNQFTRYWELQEELMELEEKYVRSKPARTD